MERFAANPTASIITFTVSSREKQKARTVRQQLWARAVELSDGRQARRTQ
jgi:hypothetical protein